MDGEKLVFVYGTLKRGWPMGDWLNNNAEFVDTAAVKGHVIYDLGAFPGMKHTGNDEDIVFGEVFLVTDEAVIERMNQYEGVRIDNDTNEHIGLYRPTFTEAYLSGSEGEHEVCLGYLYLGDVSNRTPLKDGVYL